MTKLLLITPPFVQPNSPYPATAYLKGYLNSQGFECEQCDLSIELLDRIFSSGFLRELFSAELYGRFVDGTPIEDTANIRRMYTLRNRYITTIDIVKRFLCGHENTAANLICSPDFLPQAARFETMTDIDDAFGVMGNNDCAKYLATLYLQDISDYIRATLTDKFEIVRYGEKLSVSVPSFRILEEELSLPLNLIESRMLDLLDEKINNYTPTHVGFTIPFPGNLLSALRCGQHIKKNYPQVITIAGGGYPSTELRSMSDKGIFKYFDHIVLDDGEIDIENILSGKLPAGGYSFGRPNDGVPEKISHMHRGCPDFSGLAFDKYFSLLETVNPMHRLWGDGMWNKMMISHGCYWAKCAFCDTALDYIKCYDSVPASTIVDWMETVSATTGSRGFHFVDEAASPKMLKEISLEILRRGLSFTWWTNIRFESAFTGDLCRLMAAAGCIAVSGGLEIASDRLLAVIDKGLTIETATITMRNFFYAGIMVHTYLMYGFPTQTLEETVDSLETVRQMFRAKLIDSAFWHRYAMTVHSPSGCDPEKYGVRRKNNHVNTFANNEIFFVEDRGYNIQMAGDALRTATAAYMAGEGLGTPVHKWFTGKTPQTTVEQTQITDHLIKPDQSRIYNPAARLVWIGADITRTGAGIHITTPSEEKEIAFDDTDADFMIGITKLVSDLEKTVKFEEISKIYEQTGKGSFLPFYHSKKWDRMRSLGLLQL